MQTPLPEPAWTELEGDPTERIRAYIFRVAPELEAGGITFSYVELARVLEMAVSYAYLGLNNQDNIGDVDWRTFLRQPNGRDLQGPVPEFRYKKGRRLSPSLVEAFRDSGSGMSVGQIQEWYRRRRESVPRRITWIQPILQAVFFGTPA